MANVEHLVLRLDAQVDEFNANIKRAAKETEASNRRMQNSIANTESQIKQFSMASIRHLTAFAAAVGVAMSTREIIRYADTWNRVQNRMILATSSGKEAADTLQDIVDVAKDSMTALEPTALLFQRMERGTRELGLSMSELTDITSTINKSFFISGATAQEASASIIQLSQAFARGVLRGDEFRSVSEQAPIILEAISAATGQTRGELIKWAEQGALTTDVLIRSLAAYGAQVDKEFDKTARTIGMSMNVAQTEFTQFIGTLDDTNQLTEKFGNFIVNATKDLDDLVPVINKGADRLMVWLEQWILAFGPEGQKSLTEFTTEYSRQMMAFRSITKVTGEFIVNAFMNMPANIAAAVKIATTELVHFISNIPNHIRNMILDLNEAFSGITTNQNMEERKQLLQDINAHNEARTIAIALIIKQRDEELLATDELIANKARVREQAANDADDTEDEDEDSNEAFIKLQLDETKFIKKEEAIRKRLRNQARRDALSILGAMAGDSEGARKAMFIVSQGAAAAEVFISTKVAAAGAMRDFPYPGSLAIAAAIEAGGALSIAAILATTIAGVGGSGGSSSSSGGGGVASTSASITTGELPSVVDQDVRGTVVSDDGVGVSVQNIRFVAEAGDDLGDMIAEWINKNIKKGRIETGG